MTFPDTDKNEWLKRIQKDLKDQDISTLMRSMGEVNFPPFVHRDDLGAPPLPLSRTNKTPGWEIAAYLKIQDIATANALAHEELSGGVNALWIDLDRDPGAEDLDQLLGGIEISFISLHWNLSGTWGKKDFFTWWENKVRTSSPIRHSITLTGEDPSTIGKNALVSFMGEEALSQPENSIEALSLWVIGIADFLERQKEEIRSGAVRLVTPVGGNILWEISRLRAIHLLMAHLAKAYHVPDDFYRLETISSQAICRLSPNDHKIATPLIGMASVAGGADSICLPVSVNAPSDKMAFHRRIARNVHHLLIQEAGLSKVMDPAAGSFFFETLTEQIAEASWASIQKMIAHT